MPAAINNVGGKLLANDRLFGHRLRNRQLPATFTAVGGWRTIPHV